MSSSGRMVRCEEGRRKMKNSTHCPCVGWEWSLCNGLLRGLPLAPDWASAPAALPPARLNTKLCQ